MPYAFSFTAAKCTSIIIKMSGSESRGQEEATRMHVFRPIKVIYIGICSLEAE